MSVKWVSARDIYSMAETSTPSNANEFIVDQLHRRIKALEDHLDVDVLSFNGPIIGGVDDLIRTVVEKRFAQAPKHDRLWVVLTTGGGYIEVVQRIVDTFRRYYDLVDFIIPNCAYSAGTVLAMSGDSIYMDYYSRLGPIDPQIEIRDGHMVPALGYLERYDALIQKANAGTISLAEVQLLIEGFDQAELYQYEQARELSITLLKEWLVKYKFKNWTTTKTRKKEVTSAMRTSRAAQIAKELNNTAKWHVHGRGISREVLERDLKLKIDDFESDSELNDKIRDYHSLLDDYMSKLGVRGIAHTYGNYRPYA
jgi:hypothetical protein